MSEPATPGELNLVRTIIDALGVIRRRWVALAVLGLGFLVVPDAVIWLVNGQRPVDLQALSAGRRAAVLGLDLVADALLSLAAAKVVFADRLTGRGAGPLEAMAFGWGRLVSALYVSVLVSIPTIVIEIAPGSGPVIETLDLAAFVLESALFGLAVPALVNERLSGPWAAVRAFRLTRGFRVRLIGAYALAVTLQLFTAATVGSAVLLLGDGPGLTALAEAGFSAVFKAGSLFFAVWPAILYLALAKAQQGLREGEDEVFS